MGQQRVSEEGSHVFWSEGEMRFMQVHLGVLLVSGEDATSGPRLGELP